MNSTTNLYETTKQELEAIGALDGPKEPQDAQNSKMGTSQSMCAGTFSTTWSQNKKKIKINMTPSKPMPFTRYHFFKKMPQLPLDRVSNISTSTEPLLFSHASVSDRSMRARRTRSTVKSRGRRKSSESAPRTSAPLVEALL